MSEIFDSSIVLPTILESFDILASVINTFRSISEIIVLNASLSGSNFLPKNTISSSDMKSRGKPIFDSSNIDMESISGYRRFEPIIPLARIFVLVPISVQQPPKIDAYETGISILDEEIL